MKNVMMGRFGGFMREIKKNRRKRAFTLTELLVVVIVIGVLAAAVLPKFSKVIETRKTTEAEEIMAAVRMEQEKRCALDKNYTTNADTVNLASLTTKHFSYTLKNTGMEALSKGKYAYTLKMPSYRDGRLCCDSADQCAKLNKNYPLCAELTAKADYMNGVECTAGMPEPDDTPKACLGEPARKCGCKKSGMQTRSCDTTTGAWSEWGSCSVSDSCECTGEQPPSRKDCSSCGTQTRTVTCDASTGEWVPGAWGICDKTEEACQQEECGAGRILDSFSGECVCAAEADETDEYTSCSGVFEESCPVAGGGSETELRKVNHYWNSDTCSCEFDCSYEPLYWRCRRGSGSLDLKGNEYESESSAKAACEAGDKNAYYNSVHEGATICPSPNQPCMEGPSWTALWYCTDENIACGGGMGSCDPCTCQCGVG